VNSSTAFRTAAGSNEDMGWNVTDVNRETGRRGHGHRDAVARTVLCLSRFRANVGQRRDCGHGQCETSDCLRKVYAHRQCLFANGCVRLAFGDADCLLPRLLRWTGRARGLFEDMDNLCPRSALGLFAPVELPCLWT
jgi:hypothetical protein